MLSLYGSPRKQAPKPKKVPILGTLGATRAKSAPDPELAKVGEELRDRLSIPGEYDDDIIGPDGIRVPRAPNFRKPTLVVGTDLARKVEELHKVAPETRGRASFVSPHYTRSMVALLAQMAGEDQPKFKDAKEEFELTRGARLAKDALGFPRELNIRGMSDPKDRELYTAVDPKESDSFDTIAHEYQHLMGYGGKGAWGSRNANASEDTARETGEIAGRYYALKNKRKK